MYREYDKSDDYKTDVMMDDTLFDMETFKLVLDMYTDELRRSNPQLYYLIFGEHPDSVKVSHSDTNYCKDDNYDPDINGAVMAVRIYLEDGHKPMADLVFAYGGTKTIHWDCISERKEYESGITGYTLFYDERPKRKFEEWNSNEEIPVKEQAKSVNCPSIEEILKIWVNCVLDPHSDITQYHGAFSEVETFEDPESLDIEPKTPPVEPETSQTVTVDTSDLESLKNAFTEQLIDVLHKTI